ncbi:hypothetical protein AcW2_000536 [Taiwanofungus camphoratus]|nr:hypothetical protein AcW2_000536 [Antrodia cinnamomea]
MASGSPLTFNPVRGITEFIEVAVHTILYVRQVYPPDLFVRRKKYDTPVFQSRHPALNEYISGAVKAIAEELVLGTVDKVVVVIKNKDEAPLERFIFAVWNMIQVEAYNKDTSVENAMTSAVLGQYFRSFLIKLTMVECQLGQLEMGGARPSPRSLNPLPSIRPLTHRSRRRPFVRDRARAAGRQGAVRSARREPSALDPRNAAAHDGRRVRRGRATHDPCGRHRHHQPLPGGAGVGRKAQDAQGGGGRQGQGPRAMTSTVLYYILYHIEHFSPIQYLNIDDACSLPSETHRIRKACIEDNRAMAVACYPLGPCARTSRTAQSPQTSRP